LDTAELLVHGLLGDLLDLGMLAPVSRKLRQEHRLQVLGPGARHFLQRLTKGACVRLPDVRNAHVAVELDEHVNGPLVLGESAS
jgi:hypothetical protein